MLVMGKTNYYASSSASMVPGSLTISAMASNAGLEIRHFDKK